MPEIETTTEPKSASSLNLMEDLYIGTAEETFYKSSYVPDSYEMPYNADDLYKKTGDYSIYEDMMLDDQVSVCMTLKKDLVLGSGFDIYCDDDEVKKYIDKCLNDDFHTSFNEAICQMLSAYEFGFSLTEPIFEMAEGGAYKLKDLKTRHPNSWLIYQDDQGNITKYVQQTYKRNIDIEPQKMIHLINNERFQNKYGTSDLRAAYNAWFTKRQIIRFLAIFMEKAASPTPVGKYDINAPQAAVDKLFETIKKFQTKTALVIPKEIEVEFLESGNNGEVFRSAINMFNMFIGRALFTPDLIGLTGTETGGGSYSLGKEQIKLFFLHIQRRREQVEKLINQRIIKPLTLSKFGQVEHMPVFKFKALDNSQAVENAKTWLEAVKGRTYKPSVEEINYFRDLLNFPSESEIEFYGNAPQFGQTNNENTEGNLKEEEPPKEEEKEETSKEQVQDNKENYALKTPPGDYYKKVDFKAIKTKFSDYDKSVMIESEPVIKKILKDLFDQIQKKKIIQSQDISKTQNLNLKYLKELKQVLKYSFIQLYKDSQKIAQSELFKGNFKTPIPADEFLEAIDAETFAYIGDWEYSILKTSRVRLTQAIKDGESLSSTLEDLETVLNDMSETSIERYSRTKHTEVFNNARLNYFDESGVVAAYQFSAILDDRTSEICAGLDGKIFEAGNAPVPPMHFNCRSVLIPITKYEEFEVDTKSNTGQNIDKFIDQNLGTGFSKYKKNIKTEPALQKNPTDPGVDFKIVINGNVQETIYSFENKPFYKTITTHDANNNVLSLKNERIEEN